MKHLKAFRSNAACDRVVHDCGLCCIDLHGRMIPTVHLWHLMQCAALFTKAECSQTAFLLAKTKNAMMMWHGCVGQWYMQATLFVADHLGVQWRYGVVAGVRKHRPRIRAMYVEVCFDQEYGSTSDRTSTAQRTEKPMQQPCQWSHARFAKLSIRSANSCRMCKKRFLHVYHFQSHASAFNLKLRTQV